MVKTMGDFKAGDRVRHATDPSMTGTVVSVHSFADDPTGMVKVRWDSKPDEEFGIFYHHLVALPGLARGRSSIRDVYIEEGTERGVETFGGSIHIGNTDERYLAEQGEEAPAFRMVLECAGRTHSQWLSIGDVGKLYNLCGDILGPQKGTNYIDPEVDPDGFRVHAEAGRIFEDQFGRAFAPFNKRGELIDSDVAQFDRIVEALNPNAPRFRDAFSSLIDDLLGDMGGE